MKYILELGVVVVVVVVVVVIVVVVTCTYVGACDDSVWQ